MKKILILLLLCVGVFYAQPKVKKIINNKRPCIQIIEDKDETEYVLLIDSLDINKSEAEQEAIGLTKYNAIKLQEAQPVVVPDSLKILEVYRKELGAPEDQLEMIYNDMVNGTTLWRDKRTEIKNRIKNK